MFAKLFAKWTKSYDMLSCDGNEVRALRFKIHAKLRPFVWYVLVRVGSTKSCKLQMGAWYLAFYVNMPSRGIERGINGWRWTDKQATINQIFTASGNKKQWIRSVVPLFCCCDQLILFRCLCRRVLNTRKGTTYHNKSQVSSFSAVVSLFSNALDKISPRKNTNHKNSQVPLAALRHNIIIIYTWYYIYCLLYTSDAADE